MSESTYCIYFQEARTNKFIKILCPTPMMFFADFGLFRIMSSCLNTSKWASPSQHHNPAHFLLRVSLSRDQHPLKTQSEETTCTFPILSFCTQTLHRILLLAINTCPQVIPFFSFCPLFHASLEITKVFLHLLQLGNEIRVDVAQEGSCSRHIFIIASIGNRKQKAGISGQVIFFCKNTSRIFKSTFIAIECP